MTAKKKNTAEKQNSTSSASGLGLDSMGDLSSLLTPNENVTSGSPIELDVDLVETDPKQPRKKDNPGFAPESIAEIGASIKIRGVKTPISVRNNPDKPGYYIINHGERRYLGTLWAKLPTIKAFIDNDYSEVDQVVENLQREALTAREIADFIGRELSQGIKKGEIAKSLGKSAAFVTQHVTLLDLPEPIADVFNSQRCKDVTVINELVTAYKKQPDEVTNWLSDDNQEITRGTVKLLRDYLDETKSNDTSGSDDVVVTTNDDKSGSPEGHDNSTSSQPFAGEDYDDGDDHQHENNGNKKDKPDSSSSDPDKMKNTIVMVEHNGRPARLLLKKRPPAEGFAWLKYEDDGEEFEADLKTVQLTALIEG